MFTEAVVLGIVQGLTEFLPVSSTAHLILFPWFFKWRGVIDTLSFDVALHAGTLFALLLCFWKDWIEILSKRQRMLLFILAASVPAGVVGLLFNEVVETRLRSPLIISISLVSVGVVMLASERVKKGRAKEMNEMSFSDALVIGVSQAFALIPGVSRSGITISSGLFRSLEREAAARFSFLLSTPVIAGAVLLHTKKLFSGSASYEPVVFLCGFVGSAITGFFAIRFLLGYVRKNSVDVFSYYRFFLAAVIVLGIWLKK